MFLMELVKTFASLSLSWQWWITVSSEDIKAAWIKDRERNGERDRSAVRILDCNSCLHSDNGLVSQFSLHCSGYTRTTSLVKKKCAYVIVLFKNTDTDLQKLINWSRF